MHTSDRLIAYQLFSQEGYNRLRKALMQQSHLFELVASESDLADSARWMGVANEFLHEDLLQASHQLRYRQGAHREGAHQGAHQGNHHQAPETLTSAASEIADRSAQLDQWQAATRSLRKLGSIARSNSAGNGTGDQAALGNSNESAELESEGASLRIHRHSFMRQPQPLEHHLGHHTASESAAFAPNFDHSFVLMSSPTLSVLLTADPINFQEELANRSANRPSVDMPGYQVGLTFDNVAIASFLRHLSEPHEHTHLPVSAAIAQSATQGTTQGTTQNVERRASTETQARRQTDIRKETREKESYTEETHAKARPHHTTTYAKTSSDIHSNLNSSNANTLNADINTDTKTEATKVSAKEKVMAQKNFVLSWAKQLAASPTNETQTAQSILDDQLEQSLLLDQVINRIRHSLDLSDILETTVAQVRAFLSADRLVLYQFDQFDPVQIPPLYGEDGTSDSLAAALPNHQTLLNSKSHEGHITYESRISEAIPSVLNFSEEKCFENSQINSDRYLSGKPVAVDNVDEQYEQIDCLLSFLQKAQVKSKVIAPIVVNNRLWGLLIVHQCQRYRRWKPRETVFLQHIAEHLSVAIVQASLYQQVRDQTVSLESCVIERTENLHDALLAAESANVTKGEFLSTMSHELRTPLTYIIGMSATLLRWSLGVLNDRQRSYLNTINQSGEQLLGIINNILEFANIESGRSLLNVSELSLKQLVETTLEQYQKTADKQGVTLVSDYRVPPEQEQFFADSKRLRQILANLIDNAIKFTPAGGQVELRVWRESQDAVFQIEDSGIGIPDSQKDALFEKFKQLESPFQRQYSGTGLGLAMTKRLIELHGGTIHVESKVGQGSTFSVRLPAQIEKRSPAHYQVPPTLEDRTHRVILLETDENNAAVVCEMLTAAGYEVIWLVDAAQLAEQLNSLRPAMLVADLSLLSHDLEEVKTVQLSITALDTKVLALTDKPDGVPSQMAHHDILPKPIDPKVLLEKVRQLTVVS